MQIISHRGLWRSRSEQNTLTAFRQSLEGGFGIETDVRDHHGKLIIAHDFPTEDAPFFTELLELYVEINKDLPLAINIKSCGLAPMVSEAMESYQLLNYFVFDMAVPDALDYLDSMKAVFTRRSEYEKSPAFYDQAAGVWIDGFNSDWISEDVIQSELTAGKKIGLVSPELHRRPHEEIWKKYAQWPVLKHNDIFLCTDFPNEAKQIFCELVNSKTGKQ
jgi:glycerophosphoryl diester phosphodiesterase